MTESTRKVCLICGIDCFWDAYDLQWAHMGWTKDGGNEFGPHKPEVEAAGLIVGELGKTP